MTSTKRYLSQAVRIAILAGMASAAFASESPVQVSPKTPLCYCKCEHENGKPCTKMCELPQYEKRWWAASCHKKADILALPANAAPDTKSRKTNRTEEASL